MLEANEEVVVNGPTSQSLRRRALAITNGSEHTASKLHARALVAGADDVPRCRKCRAGISTSDVFANGSLCDDCSR